MRRRLPAARDVPWDELRKGATTIYRMLQAGWDELTPDERSDVRRLVSKSRGLPRNLSKDETRRLGRLAGRAAAAAGRARRKR
jgi:hypothetical protein